MQNTAERRLPLQLNVGTYAARSSNWRAGVDICTRDHDQRRTTMHVRECCFDCRNTSAPVIRNRRPSHVRVQLLFDISILVGGSDSWLKCCQTLVESYRLNVQVTPKVDNKCSLLASQCEQWKLATLFTCRGRCPRPSLEFRDESCYLYTVPFWRAVHLDCRWQRLVVKTHRLRFEITVVR